MFSYDDSDVRQERLSRGTDHCDSTGSVYAGKSGSKMSMSEGLRQLLQSDVDDILVRSREYDSRTRFRMIRDAAEEYGTLKEPLARVKAMWIVQAMLASTDDRQLPYATSSNVAPRLASIVESNREQRDARRSALDSLALIFVKTKQLTESLDTTIRLAFLAARKSHDPQLSEFATEALAGEGVLAGRSPREQSANVRDAIETLRARVNAGGRVVRHKFLRQAGPKPAIKPSRSERTHEQKTRHR